MYIYLFHENLILRRYRTDMFQYLFRIYGMEHYVLYTFVIAVIVFVISLIVCGLYKCFLARMVARISDSVYQQIRRLYLSLEAREIR